MLGKAALTPHPTPSPGDTVKTKTLTDISTVTSERQTSQDGLVFNAGRIWGVRERERERERERKKETLLSNDQP